jgi:hypothetical protein
MMDVSPNEKARYFNKWIIDVIDRLTMSLMETTGIVDLKQGKLRYITILIQIKIEKKKSNDSKCQFST